MRRLVFLALCGLVLSSFACRKEKTPATSGEAPPAAVEVEDRPLTLWSVTKPGMPTSHLFGMCDVGVELGSALSPEGKELLQRSGRLIAEADTRELEAAEEEMMAAMTLPEGTTLSGLLGADAWATLVELSGLGPMAAFFDTMHPAVLELILALETAASIDGASPDAEMSDAVFVLAEEAGVEVRFLETLEEELALFLEAPLEGWLLPLQAVVAAGSLGPIRETTAATLNLCLTGDLEGGWRVIEGRTSVLVQGLLLAERNQRWLPTLAASFAEAETFVAVSAANMLGEQGLVGMLRSDGWAVTRLNGRTSVVEDPQEFGVGVASSDLVEAAREGLAPTFCPMFTACFGLEEQACVATFEAGLTQCLGMLEIPETVEPTELEEFAALLSLCAVGTAAKPLGEPNKEDPACEAEVAKLEASFAE